MFPQTLPQPQGASRATPRARSRFRAVLVALTIGAMAVTLTACGGSKKSSDSPSAQDSESGAKLAAVWPLTGLPLNGRAPSRPIIAVKIPNTPEAQPQAGLGDADMISEELVEGGITRLAVFFYSKVPALAGPVRSMRASDIGIVRPLRATIVSSGAAPPTLHRLTKAKVPFFTGGPGYFREPTRTAPYNLMVHLDNLARTLKKPKHSPAPYLQWGKESDFKAKKRARTIAATFSGYRTSEFAYKGGTYINTNSYSPAGDVFKANTVLVMRVRWLVRTNASAPIQSSRTDSATSVSSSTSWASAALTSSTGSPMAIRVSATSNRCTT